MKKKLLLAACLLLNVFITSAQCGWVDGQDPRIGFDPGRGITRWNDHYNYGIVTRDINSCASFVGDRMLTLTKCLNMDQYGKLYADVSVKIAEYGIQNAGWRNNLNNTLPNDGGCGILDWNMHYNYIKVNGYSNAAELVKNRMIFLQATLRENYSRLYADVSVIIAQYGVGGYYQAATVSQTTTTTTTTNQVNPANVNINMNIGGVGMNMNVNDPNYNQATVVQHTTTTTVNSGYVEEPVVVQQGPCRVSDGDFAQMESSINSKPFAETKMSTAQLALKGRCLSINQIRSLTLLFSFAEDRLNFLKYAIDYTNDQANYYTLSNTLSFDSDVDNFNTFLSGRR